MNDGRENAGRRRSPRIIDTDWLVLRGLRRGIAAALDGRDAGHAGAIDLGCGTQPYRPIVEARGITYRGADLGDTADHKIGADGRVEADSASADIVLSFQVLEHVRDLDTYLGECRRLLRPGGRLLLSTHGTWLYHPHPEDHRRWTREGLIAELAQRGLTVISCEAIVGPLAWTSLIRLTSFAFVFRKLPVLGNALAAALAVVMNSRAWVEDKVTPAAVRDHNACVYLVEAQIAEALA